MTDEALTYVELDVDYCPKRYAETNGAGTCLAVLGVDSPAKCFNSKATCAKLTSYANTPVTLRFAVDTGHNPTDIDALPFIAQHGDVAITQGRISLGEDLGQRESVSVNFFEAPHSDTGPGFDKYLADRTYDPYSQGTFWAKFRARQPYLKGRPFRLYRGFVGQALADMECRHYVIDSFTGPDVGGQFTIVAKDILKLLDGDQAQAPAISLGSLLSDITSIATSATLTPTGIGSTYAASGKLAIGGNEIVTFTRSSDVLTITRAQNGTVASAHNAGDRLQVCLEYSGADPADVVYDLMSTYGGIDTAFLPLATWKTETDTFNRRLYTAIIAEPTAVRTLIQEMIVQAGLAIWWDPVLTKVYLQALRAVTADAQVLDETTILSSGTLSIAEQPEKRVSQVWVYYGQRSPLGGQDDPANYRSMQVVLDATAEANYGSAAIQKIYSRWIAFGGQSTALRIGNMQLGRYVNPPRKFTFSLMRKVIGAALVLGAGYYLGNPELQAADGSRVNVPAQVTRAKSDAAVIGYEAEENVFTSYDATDALTVVIDTNIRSINLRTLYDTLYTAPVTNDTVTFIVNEEVIVGANSTAGPAIDVGTWPSAATTGNRTSGSPTLSSIADTSTFAVGMIVKGTGIPAGAKIISKTVNSITLDANATSGSATSTGLTVFLVKIELKVKAASTVSGAGGNGGLGAQGTGDVAGSPGLPGGAALLTRYGLTITIDVGGTLQGGGGGGGGGPTRVYDDQNGGGGGGGAGDTPGLGGSKGGNFAQAGGTATLSAAASGGLSWTSNGGLFATPRLAPPSGASGGPPGGVGGSIGTGGLDISGGAGGAAGDAIDGTSYVKLANSGTVAGPQVN